MKVSERIAQLRAQILEQRNKLTQLMEKDDADDADAASIEQLTADVERDNAELDRFLKAEKALALGARPAGGEGAGGESGDDGGSGGASRGAPGLNLRHSSNKNKGAGSLIIRSAIAAFESYVTHRPAAQIIEQRWPDNTQLAEASKMLVGAYVPKAQQNPAMTMIAGWAQELVRESYAEFMDLLVAESLVPQIPMYRYEFDGYGKIVLPMRAANPGGNNLAAAFRAEGAPIRVGAAKVGSKVLTPKTMGVISTFTKEMLRRSTPQIEQLCRGWMLEDTAEALDFNYLDTFPGDDIRPAGLQSYVGAEDTAPSTGNTAANIQADVRARVTGLTDARLGKRPVWLMNPARATGVAMSITASGDKAYPEASGPNPTLAGFPILTSINVPSEIVFLLDSAYVGFAGGAPMFEGTDVATIHEDDGLPLASGRTGPSVQPIVTGAGDVAAPVRSLFQTHSAALKAVWEVDWTVVREHAVQTITDVAW